MIGASGVGKTSGVRCLEARARSGVKCLYFDSIGVPSHEAMKLDFGSGEGWQAAATKTWISRIVCEAACGATFVLEGQTRPSFVMAAIAYSLRVRIVLLECSSSERVKRLDERGQSHLVTLEMDMWADYLRGQADVFQLTVVDTTDRTPDDVADLLEREIETVRATL